MTEKTKIMYAGNRDNLGHWDRRELDEIYKYAGVDDNAMDASTEDWEWNPDVNPGETARLAHYARKERNRIRVEDGFGLIDDEEWIYLVDEVDEWDESLD